MRHNLKPGISGLLEAVFGQNHDVTNGASCTSDIRNGLCAVLESCLTQTEYAVVKRFFLDGKKPKQIQEELGISITWVSTCRTAAIQKLQSSYCKDRICAIWGSENTLERTPFFNQLLSVLEGSEVPCTVPQQGVVVGVKGCRVLRDFVERFQVLVQSSLNGEATSEQVEAARSELAHFLGLCSTAPDLNTILSWSIKELGDKVGGISLRSINACERNGIKTVGMLVRYWKEHQSLANIPDLGDKSASELAAALGSVGIASYEILPVN